MADILIRNAYVVTMNPDRVIYADGAVAITGNRITAVGPTADVAPENPAPLTIDGRGMLVTPGLIDAHHHPNQYLSNGIGDDCDIMTLLYRRLYPYEAALTEEEAYLSALGGFVEAIQYGTTCFNDPGGASPDAFGRAAVDVGIRGILTRSTRDIYQDGTPIPESMKEDAETNLRETAALIDRWHGAAEGRIRAWASLRYVFNVSDDLCRGIKALADDRGIGIHAHAAAVKGENEAMMEVFGERSLTRFHKLGLFGPNLYLIHMGYPDEREVDLMAESDVKVVHCPSASMLGAYGVFQNGMMPAMATAGITIALGTDSATAGGHLDMVREMYLAAAGHKDRYADATLWGAYKALEMATIDGARACLWDDEIGSLEVGKKADVVLFRMQGIEWHPGRNPVNALVYSATGKAADTVIIDGRVVMRERVMLTVDDRAVVDALHAANAAWRSRTGVTTPPPWPVR